MPAVRERPLVPTTYTGGPARLHKGHTIQRNSAWEALQALKANRAPLQFSKAIVAAYVADRATHVIGDYLDRAMVKFAKGLRVDE